MNRILIVAAVILLFCGQCGADPSAMGFFGQDQVGLAIPSVFGAWGDDAHVGCKGMILLWDESGVFLYDESLTWDAPCNADAAFVLPAFDPATGVLKIPVLMFGGKFFWAEIDGFNVLDWGQYETQ